MHFFGARCETAARPSCTNDSQLARRGLPDQWYNPGRPGADGWRLETMKRLFLLALLLAGLVAPVKSQKVEPPKAEASPAQKRAHQDEPVRISVTLVQVDAIVTDGKGRQ